MIGLRDRRYRRPELPLVPLIDVLVMLVLFAFVTMRFGSSRTLNITVPKVQTAGQNQFTGSVEIGIDKDGRFSLNGQLVADEQLEGLLREVQRVNRETPILVRGDETTHYGRVTDAMDLARKVGLSRLILQVRR